MPVRVSQIVQYVVLALVAISLILVLIALIFPWYGSKVEVEQAGEKLKVGTSYQAFYGWYYCSGSGDLCDGTCTGLHGWTALGKDCKSVDVDTGNTRTLYVFCWLFVLVSFPALALLLVLLAPVLSDKILEKLPPAVRGFGPIGVAVFAAFWLFLAFLCFWMFLTTATCNDADDKDCDISFIMDEKSTKAGPTWGWATTVTAAGLMVFAIGGLAAHVFLARKEQGGEYDTLGGGGASYT